MFRIDIKRTCTKEKVFRYTRYIIFIFFCWLLSRSLISHKDDLFKAFSQISPLCVGIMIFLSLINILITGLRLFQVTLEYKKKISLIKCMKIYIVGRFFSLLFPQGGNLYCSLLYKKELGISFSAFISIFSAYTWLTLTVTFLITLCILVYGNFDIQLIGADARIILSICLAICLLVAMLARRFNLFIVNRNTFVSKMLAKLKELNKAILSLVFSLKLFLQFFFLSILTYIITCFFFYFGFLNIGVSPKIFLLVLLVSLLKLGMVVNITPGNIGIMELLAGYIAYSSGFSYSFGIMVILQSRVISFFNIAFLALFFGYKDLIVFLKKN